MAKSYRLAAATLPMLMLMIFGQVSNAARTTALAAAPGVPKNYYVVWSDDFSGSAGRAPDPNKWSYQTGGGGWGNHELETYTSRPTNAALDGHGHLKITARRETYTGSDGITRAYTSARITTQYRFSFGYGAMAARIKVPAGRGLWPAFWALGNDITQAGWPWCGEIDVMETQNSATTLSTNVHGPDLNKNVAWQHQTLVRGNQLAGGFHVYAATWTPDSITFALDGKPAGVVQRSALKPGQVWPFDGRFFLLLNLAVGGDGPGVSPNAQTPMPASMVVDWVRVWRQG